MWCMGLVALWHVVSSHTRDSTCVPFIGRWILNQWTIREVLGLVVVFFNPFRHSFFPKNVFNFLSLFFFIVEKYIM